MKRLLSVLVLSTLINITNAQEMTKKINSEKLLLDFQLLVSTMDKNYHEPISTMEQFKLVIDRIDNLNLSALCTDYALLVKQTGGKYKSIHSLTFSDCLDAKLSTFKFILSMRNENIEVINQERHRIKNIHDRLLIKIDAIRNSPGHQAEVNKYLTGS